MTLLLGDLRDVLPTLEPESIDAVVCDPPYELDFMGKRWDSTGVAFQRETWAHVLRVLKPGGHLLAFGGTRTYHRLAVAVEDAGFEIRDSLAWMYGSGFPKSLDVSKAIDRDADAEREVVGRYASPEGTTGESSGNVNVFGGYEGGALSAITAPATEEAARWQGWGTALKPAYEPVVVARKPFRGTVAANVLAHGVGAINIDACRIATSDALGGGAETATTADQKGVEGWTRPWMDDEEARDAHAARVRANVARAEAIGRWPANVILGHSPDCVQAGTREVASDGHFPSARPGGVEVGTVGHAGQAGLEERHTRGETVEVWECVEDCPVRLLDEQAPNAGGGGFPGEKGGIGNGAVSLAAAGSAVLRDTGRIDANGGASRFFYTAKTSRAERNAGLDGFDEARVEGMNHSPRREHGERRDGIEARNSHPTVKPIALMRWLLRLVVPPGGRILDPFLGSGTTGCAAALEGLDFVGVELDPDYLAIAEARIRFWSLHGEGALDVVRSRDEAARRRADVADTGQLDLLGEPS